MGSFRHYSRSHSNGNPLQFQDRRQAPITVISKAAADVAWAAVRRGGDTVVQRRQKRRERRPVRQEIVARSGRPVVRVVHVVHVAGIGGADGPGFLLPNQPRVQVTHRLVAVGKVAARRFCLRCSFITN
jgi:hypothetical protein